MKFGDWWQVAHPASLRNRCLPRLAASSIEAAFRRLRRAQAQLIVQQGRQLRRDEIRRLRDGEADAWIDEVAMPAHLPDAHVAVPIRDGPIGA